MYFFSKLESNYKLISQTKNIKEFIEVQTFMQGLVAGFKAQQFMNIQ